MEFARDARLAVSSRHCGVVVRVSAGRRVQRWTASTSVHAAARDLRAYHRELALVGVLYVANRDHSRLQAFYVISLILISVIAHFPAAPLRGVLSLHQSSSQRHHRQVNQIGARPARRIACVDQNILQVHVCTFAADDPEIGGSDAPISATSTTWNRSFSRPARRGRHRDPVARRHHVRPDSADYGQSRSIR